MDFVAENNNGISTLEAEIPNLDVDNVTLADDDGDYSVDLFNPVNNNNWMSDAVINMGSFLNGNTFYLDVVPLDQLTHEPDVTIEVYNDSENSTEERSSCHTSTPEKLDDSAQDQWFINLSVSPIIPVDDSRAFAPLSSSQSTISSEAESFHYEMSVEDLYLQLNSSSTSSSSTSSSPFMRISSSATVSSSASSDFDDSSTLSSPCASLTSICEEYLLESAAKRRCVRRLF